MQNVAIKLQFVKHFTKDSKLINFVKRNVKIFDTDGQIIFEDDVEVPDFWSINAINIFANKYLRKKGIPKQSTRVIEAGIPEWLQRSVPVSETEFTAENSAKQVMYRIVGAWTYWGWKGKYFENEEEAKIFFDELQYAMLHQICFPNSPQIFNTGLHWAYGIEGTPTNKQYYVDPETEKVCKSTVGYERPQPHACFILGIEDKLIGEHGVLDTWMREGILFKFGSGSGINASKWREKGAPLSGGGVSSGVVNFLSVGDSSAGAIKSGGTTRRAAKMIVLDIDHPEIEKFISWKTEEEHKMACLVTGSNIIKYHLRAIADAFKKTNTIENNPYLLFRVQLALKDGLLDNTINRLLDKLANKLPVTDPVLFDSDWRGEAYASIAGQNANNSVLITDNFMNAMLAGDDFNLIGRVANQPVATLPAKNLWDSIIENAYLTADPGVQYRNTINSWNTCDEEEIIATNPCAEYMFLNDTACNLCSFRLTAFLKNDNQFDIEGFSHFVHLFTVALEISIYMAQFPSKAIAQRSYDYRTLGLGLADLGGLLLSLGLPYDSDKGRALARDIAALLTGQVYKTSAIIAAKLGPFSRFKFNKTSMMRVMRNHARYINALDDDYENLNLVPMKNNITTPLNNYIIALWKEVLELGNQHGYRNAQATVVAPTGTIGLCMGCDTTGCEPFFSLITYKQMLEGGTIMLTSTAVTKALKYLNYSLQEISDICSYIEGTKKLTDKAPINRYTLAKFCSEKAIMQIEAQIPNSFSLHGVFSANIFDKIEDINRRKLNILFTPEEIQLTEELLYGKHTIEGAPHLKAEHLPIFDCAMNCGKFGSRYIHWTGHVKMLAAMSPVISGGLSKTVNLPRTATRKEVSECYLLAWRLGVKACALYVDGCKASQPLNLQARANKVASLDKVRLILEEIAFILIQQGYSDADLIKKRLLERIGRRANKRSLPMKRGGYSRKVYIGQEMEKFILRTGEYEDGSVGEIFITAGQGSPSYKELLNSIAILISLALQYEIPLEEIAHLLYSSDFAPNGPVTGHESINSSSSIISLVIEDLIRNYSKTQAGQEILDALEADKTEIYEMMCLNCKHTKLKRSGRCFVCTNCGSTTGCS